MTTVVAHIEVRMASGFHQNLEEAVQPALIQVAKEVEEDIKRNAPVDTGELVRSVRRRGTVITISAPYWHFVEYGTRPHIIRPRRRQALWWPDAHHPVRQVYHPGTQAQPFIRPAALRQRRLRPGISVGV
jgi:HK97 gp10 family phage protein